MGLISGAARCTSLLNDIDKLFRNINGVECSPLPLDHTVYDYTFYDVKGQTRRREKSKDGDWVSNVYHRPGWFTAVVSCWFNHDSKSYDSRKPEKRLENCAFDWRFDNVENLRITVIGNNASFTNKNFMRKVSYDNFIDKHFKLCACIDYVVGSDYNSLTESVNNDFDDVQRSEFLKYVKNVIVKSSEGIDAAKEYAQRNAADWVVAKDRGAVKVNGVDFTDNESVITFRGTDRGYNSGLKMYAHGVLMRVNFKEFKTIDPKTMMVSELKPGDDCVWAKFLCLLNGGNELTVFFNGEQYLYETSRNINRGGNTVYMAAREVHAGQTVLTQNDKKLLQYALLSEVGEYKPVNIDKEEEA